MKQNRNILQTLQVKIIVDRSAEEETFLIKDWNREPIPSLGAMKDKRRLEMDEADRVAKERDHPHPVGEEHARMIERWGAEAPTVLLARNYHA